LLVQIEIEIVGEPRRLHVRACPLVGRERVIGRSDTRAETMRGSGSATSFSVTAMLPIR